jgi:hypothetical protein
VVPYHACEVKLEYLELTVRRREVGEVLVVAGELQHADKCGRECSTSKNAVMTELETSARPERKRMTNHNTPQLSGMDSANLCAAFPGLSALSTTTIRCLIKHWVGGWVGLTAGLDEIEK